MSEQAPENTGSDEATSGDTTVNTGGGDAVINEAPDGGGVDNAASDGSESSEK